MGGNSFLLKGWSVSLVTAVIVFGVTRDSSKESVPLLLVAASLILVFWLLDAYYLSQERAFTGLYESVGKKAESNIDYSLDARDFLTGYGTWSSAMLSKVFLIFYAPAFFILLILCARLVEIDIYLK